MPLNISSSVPATANSFTGKVILAFYRREGIQDACRDAEREKRESINPIRDESEGMRFRIEIARIPGREPKPVDHG